MIFRILFYIWSKVIIEQKLIFKWGKNIVIVGLLNFGRTKLIAQRNLNFLAKKFFSVLILYNGYIHKWRHNFFVSTPPIFQTTHCYNQFSLFCDIRFECNLCFKAQVLPAFPSFQSVSIPIYFLLSLFFSKKKTFLFETRVNLTNSVSMLFELIRFSKKISKMCRGRVWIFKYKFFNGFI